MGEKREGREATTAIREKVFFSRESLKALAKKKKLAEDQFKSIFPSLFKEEKEGKVGQDSFWGGNNNF